MIYKHFVNQLIQNISFYRQFSIFFSKMKEKHMIKVRHLKIFLVYHLLQQNQADETYDFTDNFHNNKLQNSFKPTFLQKIIRTIGDCTIFTRNIRFS